VRESGREGDVWEGGGRGREGVKRECGSSRTKGVIYFKTEFYIYYIYIFFFF
jgi:hypothetical protein